MTRVEALDELTRKGLRFGSVCAKPNQEIFLLWETLVDNKFKTARLYCNREFRNKERKFLFNHHPVVGYVEAATFLKGILMELDLDE
jgi:hypothetical protein